MQTTGRIRNVLTGIDGFSVMLQVREIAGLEKLKDEEVSIEIKKPRKARSLDANSYYQVLTHKIAEEVGISHAEYHNRALAEVGIAQTDDEGEVIISLWKDTDWWLKQLPGQEHYAPTGYVELVEGEEYRWFYLLKPSRKMNSKEMATLIDYVIQDANALGIPTLSETERKRLEGYEINYN